MTGLLWLQDARLKPLALSQYPAWVWSHDARRVLWANPVAAALFDAPTPAALTTRIFDDGNIAAAEVARLAATLRPDGAARLERLRGFGAALGLRSTCSCRCIRLADGRAAVLIAAIERSGRDLPLDRRVSQLLAAGVEPIAIFADDGVLIGATPSARRRLAGKGTLASLGADALTDRMDEPPVWIVTFEPEPQPARGAPRDDAPVEAPRLSAVEQHAFHELSRQLARRINEADALAARAANTNAPSEPHAAPDPSHATTGVADGERPFLDRLPIGVLVDRRGALLYANPAFLRWSGHDSLEAMAARGGLDSLTVEPGGTIAAQEDRQSFSIASPRDGAPEAQARRLAVPWEGEWASALLVMPQDTAASERTAGAKSDVLAMVNQEIRTPLNTIIGFSEAMMQERFGSPHNERDRQRLTDIHAAGEHLRSIVDDLADLSALEAGKRELAFAEVSLNDITQQCVALMQPRAARARVIMRTSLSPQLPPATADAHSLRRIVLNLLSNAIAATSPGGQTIVSTAMADSENVLLRIRVSDTMRTGGFGLPLSKALAEANRATLDIKSAPNEGTLVEIAFPRMRLLAAQ